MLAAGLSSSGLQAQVPLAVGVAWKPNSEPDLAGYHVYYGPQSGVYTNRVTVGPTVNRARVEPLVAGANYYLALVAFNTAGFESLPTAELFYKAPISPGANTPPGVSVILPQTLLEDHASRPIAFTVQDAESAPNTLTVRARSSNPRLIPDQYVLIGGAGIERTLMIVPQLDQWGTANITLEVRDPQGASNAMTFPVTVEPMNDDPVISPMADQTLEEDVVTKLPFYVFDAETPPDELWLIAVSSDQSVVPDQNIVVHGTSNSRALVLTPREEVSGSCIIDLFVVDSEGAYAWIWFTVTVKPFNDPPTLDPIPSFTIDEGVGPVVVHLSGISSGAPNESQDLIVGAMSSDPEIIPTPQVNYISPNDFGSLVIAPLSNTNGTAVITVFVSDGEADMSRSFTVSVRPFNNPPVLLALPDLAVLRLPTPLQVHFTVMDPDTPLDELILTAQSSDTSVLPNSNLIFSGSGTQRTLTVNPLLGRTGLATVSLLVSDGESTVSASFYVLITTATPDSFLDE